MLVLSRKVGQRIYAGENQAFMIEVLAIHGKYIRLGLKAPVDFPIYREEVLHRFPKPKIASR